MTRLWCNGQWMNLKDFPASATDRGVTLGLGLFETVLAVDGTPVFVGEHLARLRASCERLGWHVPIPNLSQEMRELLVNNDLSSGRSRIRLSISGGSGTAHSTSLGADHVIWMQATHASIPPMTTTAVLSPFVKNERSALAGLKCTSYAENVLALEHAGRLGYEEAVFLNTTGHICEAATANVFLVCNGKLLTPSLESGCLPGITREIVIGLANQAGIPCETGSLTQGDLSSADELFLTSSIRGVMGVARFGDRNLPVGATTGILREAWDLHLAREINSGPSF